MRRSCNLELELRLSSSDECSSSLESLHHQSCQDLQQEQQLTTFYNGVMCTCDVIELQARAILCVANNELGKIVVKTSTTSSSIPSGSYELSSPSAHYSPPHAQAVLQQVVYLSIKKSLRKFLQKRKHRSQATHPYH